MRFVQAASMASSPGGSADDYMICADRYDGNTLWEGYATRLPFFKIIFSSMPHANISKLKQRALWNDVKAEGQEFFVVYFRVVIEKIQSF